LEPLQEHQKGGKHLSQQLPLPLSETKKSLSHITVASSVLHFA